MIALLAGGACSLAGPLNPSAVPANAKWFAHMDVEAAVKSKMGSFLRENKALFRIEGLDAVERDLGFDPLKEVRGVTIFSSSSLGEDEEEPTLVAATSALVEQKAEELSAKQPGFRKVSSAGLTYFSWDDDDETKYAAVLPGKGADERLVVFAPDEAGLRAAAAVVSGKKPGLAANSPLLATAPRAGSFLYGAVSSIKAEQEEGDPGAAVLRQSERGTLDVGEAGDEMFADLTLAAKGEKEAANIGQVAGGLLALGRMVAGEDPDMKPLVEAANAITISVEGRNVMLRGRYPVEKASAALKAMAHKAQEHEHEHGEHHGEKHGRGRERKHEGGNPKE